MDAATLKTRITEAIGAHGAWKMKLRTACATGRLPVPAAEIARHDACALGRWLAEFSRMPGAAVAPEYAEVKRLHAEFHRVAGGIAARIEAGAPDEASRMLSGGMLDAASQPLVQALGAWKAKAG